MSVFNKNILKSQIFAWEKQNGEVFNFQTKNKPLSAFDLQNFRGGSVNKFMKIPRIADFVEESSQKAPNSDNLLYQSLANFKMHLHNSSIMNNSPQKSKPRNKSLGPVEHQAMKDRLSKKIHEAQKKMIAIKQGLKQCQVEKQEIIKRSNQPKSL